jgi:hypothetical protein
MSGLSSFMAKGSVLRLQGTATLRLPATNALTFTDIELEKGNIKKNAVIYLGTVNTLHADTFTLSEGGAQASTIQFPAGAAERTVTIRNKAGTGSANLTMGWLNTAGSGGGHGGLGGNGNNGAVSGSRGAVYGSATEPLEPGSGGGSHVRSWVWNDAGGNGGGTILLDISDTLMLNGQIKANGGPASDNTSQDCGGGAGGSILIRCRRFDGGSTGWLYARGGSGYDRGGGGGGGRISVFAQKVEWAYTNNVSVAGGSGYTAAGAPAAAGAVLWTPLPAPGTVVVIR